MASPDCNLRIAESCRGRLRYRAALRCCRVGVRQTREDGEASVVGRKSAFIVAHHALECRQSERPTTTSRRHSGIPFVELYKRRRITRAFLVTWREHRRCSPRCELQIADPLEADDDVALPGRCCQDRTRRGARQWQGSPHRRRVRPAIARVTLKSPILPRPHLHVTLAGRIADRRRRDRRRMARPSW